MSRAFDIWGMLLVNMMFGFFINYFYFLVLAFFDSSLLRSHFWPFTPVLRRILRFITRKVGKTTDDTDITNRFLVGV